MTTSLADLMQNKLADRAQHSALIQDHMQAIAAIDEEIVGIANQIRASGIAELPINQAHNQEQTIVVKTRKPRSDVGKPRKPRGNGNAGPVLVSDNMPADLETDEFLTQADVANEDMPGWVA